MLNIDIIKEEQAECVEFGLYQGITSLLKVILLFVTAGVLGHLKEGILLLAFFIPLRSYAGGYHANTVLECMVKTWLLFCAAMLFVIYVPICLPVDAGIIVLTGFLLYLYAPRYHKNKVLESYEKVRYRRISFLIYGGYVFVLGLSLYLGWESVISCILGGELMVDVLLISFPCEQSEF